MQTIFGKKFATDIFGKQAAELQPDDFFIEEDVIFQTLFSYKNNLDEILQRNIAAIVYESRVLKIIEELSCQQEVSLYSCREYMPIFALLRKWGAL